MNDIAIALGLPPLAGVEGLNLGIAVAAAAAAIMFGVVIAPLVSSRIAGRLGLRRSESGAPINADAQLATLTRRLARAVRHGAAALIISMIVALWDPSGWAALALGVALAFSSGLAARAVMIAVDLGGITALAAGVIAGGAAFSSVVGGLDRITASLSGFGFALGTMRLSLLTMISVAVVGLVLYTAIRLANRLVSTLVRRSRRLDEAQSLLVEKLAAVAIITVAFFVGIDLVGIDLTAFAVFSGALGLAVGFGLQKTFGNLIAGIILLMDRSIKPGDVIVVGGAVGRVNKIGVRAVSVVTREGKEHLVPNELLMTERVENWSYSSRDVRVTIVVGVGYDADIRLAQQLLLEAAQEAPRVLSQPAPVVWITAFGDNAVEHELRLWIADPEGGLGNIQGDVFMRIWDKFKANGITIPYPRRDVRIVAGAPADVATDGAPAAPRPRKPRRRSTAS